ncbi:GNAT family N-acetyltransferase [Paracoccus aminophilus]|uniref:N-acetyltransferase n=1 Tax=Paracoccus aminophilus JCM 7686 TaxID=1367847 RepID=S5XVG4_PARAH|nr:GNAT family N-acetyltransferase [Paracoccus aminophilus]AGT07365.1 N-acetyltransferase [Paracoccus aminophilus JCM 7686]
MPNDLSRFAHHPVCEGIAPAHLDAAAALFWQAFGREVLPFPTSAARGVALIRHALRAEKALSALDPQGALAALVGIRDAEGGFLAPEAGAFAQVWGCLGGGLERVTNALHRSGPETADMVLDGLVVRPDLRGQGYGRALIAAASHRAARRGYHGLRAEVARANAAARALYLSLGFQPLGQSRIGWPWSGPAEIMRLEIPAAHKSRSSRPPVPEA